MPLERCELPARCYLLLGLDLRFPGCATVVATAPSLHQNCWRRKSDKRGTNQSTTTPTGNPARGLPLSPAVFHTLHVTRYAAPAPDTRNNLRSELGLIARLRCFQTAMATGVSSDGNKYPTATFRRQCVDSFPRSSPRLLLATIDTSLPPWLLLSAA